MKQVILGIVFSIATVITMALIMPWIAVSAFKFFDLFAEYAKWVMSVAK